jgi:hypothetical protein
MNNAIAILSSELASIESKIRDDKGNDKRLIDKKNQIQEAIRWLKQLQEFGGEKTESSN